MWGGGGREGGECCVICFLITRPNPLTFLNLVDSRSLVGGGWGGREGGECCVIWSLITRPNPLTFLNLVDSRSLGGVGWGEGGRGVLRYLFPYYKT